MTRESKESIFSSGDFEASLFLKCDDLRLTGVSFMRRVSEFESHTAYSTRPISFFKH